MIKINNIKVFNILYGFIRPYRIWLLLCSVSNLMLILFNILRTFHTQQLVGNAMEGKTASLIHSLIILAGLTLVSLVVVYMSSYSSGRFGLFTTRDIKYSLFKRLSYSRISEIDKLKVGDILSRNNAEMGNIHGFLQDKIPKLVYQPLMFIAASAFMLVINWKLYLICYCLTPVSIFLINKCSKKSAKYSNDYYKYLANANSIVKECIDGVTTIKTYNLSNHIISRCKKAFGNVLKSVLKSEKYDSISLPFYFMIYESPKIFCLLFGGLAVINGSMNIGGLVAYIQLILFISAPIMTLSSLAASIRSFIVAFKRISELLEIQPEKQITQNTTVENEKTACLEFKNVTFKYGESDTGLDGISFKISMGKNIAIVGASGEGKSTIMNLICGLYEANGDILLNNKTYKELNTDYIRSKISYVSQGAYLFPVSIYENIAFGYSEATMEQVILAAQTAKCHEFIMDLPDKYYTIVGEKGYTLSGGQRQRITIARAVLKDAPLILMDEPTSALDMQTEADIMNDVLNIAKNKTLIISAHRFSTIKQVDMILVLSGGKIVEQGTHDELIAINGVYKGLYSKQFSISAGETSEKI